MAGCIVYDDAKRIFNTELESIRASGLHKSERVLESPQAAEVTTEGKRVLNLCANNYLGLSSHPRVIEAAKQALDSAGFGLSSVRFICGTQSGHKQLEERIARFLGMEDAILYSSCFDANGGLFETLLDAEDAVISDALNHASIIDGIRLCKAERLRYPNGDMTALEQALQKTQERRLRLIATDGVFSMDGTLAQLDQICDLADRYGALVMVDDSHATGFMGPRGRGTAEHHGVAERVDIITSTLGKALGGASGGFTAARKEVVELLRQRSRPYLFSNSLAPAVVGASLAVLDLLEDSDELRRRVMDNARDFRNGMQAAGFSIKSGIHPIVPIMIGDANVARDMADQLLHDGIYVIGFSYPVVPKGQARIRVQLSSEHTREQLDHAIAAFVRVGHALGLLR